MLSSLFICVFCKSSGIFLNDHFSFADYFAGTFNMSLQLVYNTVIIYVRSYRYHDHHFLGNGGVRGSVDSTARCSTFTNRHGNRPLPVFVSYTMKI